MAPHTPRRHSPYPSGVVFWPWSATAAGVSGRVAGAYGVLARALPGRTWLGSAARLSAFRRGDDPAKIEALVMTARRFP